MPTKRCAHSLCNSDSRYSHRDYMEGVKFFPFVQPSEDLEKCKRWIQACRREAFTEKNITNYTYVCSKHFLGGAPSQDYPDPFPPKQPFPKRRKQIDKEKSSCKRLKTEALETVETEPVMDIDLGEEVGNEDSQMKSVSTQTEETSFGRKLIDIGVNATKDVATVATDTNGLSFKKDFSGQTPKTLLLNAKDELSGPNWLNSRIKTVEMNNKAIVAPWPGWSFNLLKNYPEDFKYLCGLSVEDFLTVYEFLGEENCNSLKYKVGKKTPKKSASYSSTTSKDKLLMFMVRIRRGFTIREISIFFKLSNQTVSQILYVWTQFLYYELVPLRKLMFVSTRIQKKTTPACFRYFKNIRVILDCFEVELQMSKNFAQQGNTYSNYKSRNTVKFLLGITVNGAISYISDSFEGSISDKEIVLQSDIRDFLEWGESIMTDRGFDIEGEMLDIGVKVIMPPFLQGRDRFTPQEEILTKKIAKARIFVEHAVRRIKEYRLFSRGALPITLCPQISQIGYIISFFSNFHSELLKA